MAVNRLRKSAKGGWAIADPVFVTACFICVLCAFPAWSQVVFREDFESVASRLERARDEGDTGYPCWTHAPPDGWEVETDEAMPQGVEEWQGWSFADRDFWAKAGGQRREEFFSATGVVAVADPDEWDDKHGPSASGRFDSTLVSPSFPVKAGQHYLLAFDSHYRQEGPQVAEVFCRFAGGEPVPLLRYTSVPDADNAGQDRLNDRVHLRIPAPAEDGKVRFAWRLHDAGNNWFWAIDNVAFGLDDPDNHAPGVRGGAASLTGEARAALPVRIEADDPDGDEVQVRVDWGDGTESGWSDLRNADEPFEFAHAYNILGAAKIRARVRDWHGAETDWIDIAEAQLTGNPEIRLVNRPYLQYARPGGITIMWEADLLAQPAAVRYARDDATDGTATAQSTPSGQGTFIYKAVLDGLEPFTEYTYQVDMAGQSVGDVGRFRTAPDGPVDFSYAVWSDSQGENRDAYPPDILEPTKTMLDHMRRRNVHFGFATGDMAESGDSYDDTQQFYLGRIVPNLGYAVPWIVAWGNHDSGSPGAILRRVADMPSRERLGNDHAGWGSFAYPYAGCLFIAIDYFEPKEQVMPWLESVLQSDIRRNARFTFLGIHVPPFCERWIDGDEELRRTLVPLMERYGVDVCFSGHTHAYARGRRNGVEYVITGGGSWLDHGEPLIRDWDFMTVGGYHDIEQTIDGEPIRLRYTREAGHDHRTAEPRDVQGGLINEWVEVQVAGDAFRAIVHGFDGDGRYVGIIDEFGRGENDPNSPGGAMALR